MSTHDPRPGEGYFAPPVPSDDPPAGLAGRTYATSGDAYVLSGWWRRVGATVIDSLVLGAVVGLLAVLMLLAGIGIETEDLTSSSLAPTSSDLILALLGFIAYVAYLVPMMAATNGRTLGRMATGIRVVRADGQPMTARHAALREVWGKYILCQSIGVLLIVVPVLDYLWPLWDKENRALHDFVGKTRVVLA